MMSNVYWHRLQVATTKKLITIVNSMITSTRASLSLPNQLKGQYVYDSNVDIFQSFL